MKFHAKWKGTSSWGKQIFRHRDGKFRCGLISFGRMLLMVTT